MKHSRLTKLVAAAALVSSASAPAIAAPLPVPAAPSLHSASAGLEVAHHRYRHYRHHRHRDRGVDAGDVIAGILVLGGIAAIASAASNNRDEPRRVRARVPEREEPRGLSRAEQMCVDAVERERGRVASVDGSARDASGWLVSGELERGALFSCRIGNDGRISEIRLDYDAGTGSTVFDEGTQYDERTYARARADQRAGGSGVPAYDDIYEADVQPEYPGGPYPGERPSRY